MKIALICLTHYFHTKQLILRQLSTLPYEFFVVEVDAPGERGFNGLRAPDNVRFVPCERLDEDVLAEKLSGLGIEQIASFSDRGVVMAARLRARFGLTGNSVETELLAVDKGAMRRKLNQSGLSDIGYEITTIDRLAREAPSLPMPFIIKPIGMSGSLCVELIETAEALRSYVARCKANKVFRDGNVIIEEYMPGKEFSVEGVVIGGRVTFLGVTESHTSGSPYFVGTGHDFFSKHPDAARIEPFIAKVVACLQFDYCPFHIEAKYTENGFEVIEVHTRFGGAMIMELVEHATGFAPFAGYVQQLCDGGDVEKKTPDGLVYSQHLLVTGEGVIDRISLGVDFSKEKDVISYSLDYADGSVIERDILPVNRVGYVTFKSSGLNEANAFRRFVDDRLTISLS